MLVTLEEGLGVSLVNKVPEELVFITLYGIYFNFIRTAPNEVLDLRIQNIQVRLLRLPHPSTSKFTSVLFGLSQSAPIDH